MQSKLEPLKALLNSISSNTSVKEDELLHNLIVLRNTKKVDQKLSSFNGVEVKDLMTTMDQRYNFDEKSLRHFVPDMPLQATTRRIRLRLEKARKRDAAKRARTAR